MTSESANDPMFGPAAELSRSPKRTRSVHQLLSSGPTIRAESMADPELDSLALDSLLDESHLFRLDEALAVIRCVPSLTTRLADSAPAWCAGFRAERQVGPIIDRLGRSVWIDVFRRVRQLSFVRTAGAAPFLTVDLLRFRSKCIAKLRQIEVQLAQGKRSRSPARMPPYQNRAQG